MATHVSSPSVSERSIESEFASSDTTGEFSEKKRRDFSVCPFKLQWSFGINAKVPLINLSNENRRILAYACSHVVMIYDYRSKEMFPFQGHKNAVGTLSAAYGGKWLLSADFGEDCVVVVWDTEIRVPICTLFNPHGKEGMAAARISQNAKYIVTVGNEKSQKVFFWLWTYGRELPDASVELTDYYSDRVKEISFNEESAEEFVLTADFHVIFLTWCDGSLHYYRPEIDKKSRRCGTFNCSCYVAKTRDVLTATTNGYVLVWSIFDEELSKNSVTNHINRYKRKTKRIQLQKCSITTIQNYNEMIVTGNSRGRISFYDQQLKLLYWCENDKLEAIRTISFAPCLKFAPTQKESDLTIGNGGRTMDDTDTSVSRETCEDNDRGDFIDVEEAHDGLEDEPGTVSSKLSINIEYLPRKYSNNIHRAGDNAMKNERPYAATDATLQHAPFNVANFIVCTSGGVVALVNISRLKCYFIFPHESSRITCLDAHPESKYVITGDSRGRLSLYNYEQRKLVVSRTVPALPDLGPILETQAMNDRITYITCPQIHESLKAPTALKYSPKCDMLSCGLENGALWILRPITLEPLDAIPYKHSCASIQNIAYSSAGEYMAYSDNALTVGVFKKNADVSSEESANLWNFLGKYHSHRLPIRSILFGPPAMDNNVYRFFSLGEDRELVEYDLEKSGPYPDPGLMILQIYRIEQFATPLCLDWHPPFSCESFFIVCNSEYKYRLINDLTKTQRGTFLGPVFDSPVQKFTILAKKRSKRRAYMIFCTNKEIGLQLLPLDGNPYKVVGMIGHPRQLAGFAVGCDENTLFTFGYNDPCMFMWNIKLRSADVMARLGGKGLSPFHSLIEGGKTGWLFKEMQDLFYYAQILQQNEDTISTRIISDRVSTKQIPNLMRAVGFYPSNDELENILSEVWYKEYAETGQLVEEITFEDFVKLYVNHRPTFGISAETIKEAFRTCAEQYSSEIDEDNPTMTKKEFLNVLMGVDADGNVIENGESLSPREACTYLKILATAQGTVSKSQEEQGQARNDGIDFDFLPERLSYKDFAANIMGIELPELTRTGEEE